MSLLNKFSLPFLCMALLGLGACDYSNPKPEKFTKAPFPTQTQDGKKIAAIDDGLSVKGISIVKERGEPKKAREEMASLKGLKTDTLFATETKNDAERFARLEDAVQKLSSKIESMSPAIVRLTEIDRDLENLTSQLEILVNQSSTAQSKPQFREANNTSQTLNNIPTAAGNTADNIPSTQNTAANIIKNIRIGDHANKTRIVFETSQKTDLNIFIDDVENIMSTSIGNTAMGFDPKTLGRKSSLINAVQSSVKSAADGDKTTLVFDLNGKTQKLAQGYIPPSAENANHRLYVDLKK